MFHEDLKINEIKRKIRKLKKLEIKIRFDDKLPKKDLIWDKFFNLQSKIKRNVKYNLEYLLQLNHDDYKKMIGEYFSYVYYELYQEKGILIKSIYDPTILSKLDLPYDSHEQDIKKRFRELANIYHPDKGGDSKKFIELMENYKKLIG